MALRRLDLSESDYITDVSALRSFQGLTKLDMSSCGRLVDITPLASLSALARLSLCEYDSIADFGALTSCTTLTSLDVGRCSLLVDLAPLVSCKALRGLDIRDTGVIDLSPLTCPGAGCTWYEQPRRLGPALVLQGAHMLGHL